jgi:hypothetical protein
VSSEIAGRDRREPLVAFPSASPTEQQAEDAPGSGWSARGSKQVQNGERAWDLGGRAVDLGGPEIGVRWSGLGGGIGRRSGGTAIMGAGGRDAMLP